MITIKTHRNEFEFVGVTEVWSNRLGRMVKVARLRRPCNVCGKHYEVLQSIPTRVRDRAEQLLADPPRGIRGGPYPRQWTGMPPEKDITLTASTVQGNTAIITCIDCRGQARARRRPVTVIPPIEDLI